MSILDKPCKGRDRLLRPLQGFQGWQGIPGWKSPLRYRMLKVGQTPSCVATQSGRLRRVTCWVPLEKAQSFRQVQGPVQRRLRLATVHVDTAGRGVRAVLRDRDAGEADRIVYELPELARVARRAV